MCWMGMEDSLHTVAVKLGLRERLGWHTGVMWREVIDVRLKKLVEGNKMAVTVRLGISAE